MKVVKFQVPSYCLGNRCKGLLLAEKRPFVQQPFRPSGAAAAEVLESAKTELAIQLGEDAEHWRSYWVKQFPFQNPDDFEHLLGGLRKAGLPG
jgi:hypothetical protein